MKKFICAVDRFFFWLLNVLPELMAPEERELDVEDDGYPSDGA